MHKSIPIIFAILALLVISLCSACVTQQAANKTFQQNVGLAQITLLPDSTYISFEEAKEELIKYRLYGLNKPVNKYRLIELNESLNVKTVYFMRSKDLDDSGNAAGWIFGTYNGSEAEFLVYDRTGWTTIANATLPSDEIVLDNVVSPGFLFNKNKEIISRNPSPGIPERRDLELQQGIYKLTITSGNATRILTFNATTGTLIT
jgi:hypothetical protein